METSEAVAAPARRKYARRSPGAAAQPIERDDAETDADALAAAAADLDDSAASAASQPQPTLQVTPQQLQAMIDAAVAKAVGSRASLDGPARAQAVALPDQSTIDPRTITRPVLSAQGYVVPPTYGTPAAETAAHRAA